MMSKACLIFVTAYSYPIIFVTTILFIMLYKALGHVEIEHMMY